MKVAICKYCHSSNVEPFNRIGLVYDYYCRTCQRTFSVRDENTGTKQVYQHKQDIEKSPNTTADKAEFNE